MAGKTAHALAAAGATARARLLPRLVTAVALMAALAVILLGTLAWGDDSPGPPPSQGQKDRDQPADRLIVHTEKKLVRHLAGRNVIPGLEAYTEFYIIEWSLEGESRAGSSGVVPFTLEDTWHVFPEDSVLLYVQWSQKAMVTAEESPDVISNIDAESCLYMATGSLDFASDGLMIGNADRNSHARGALSNLMMPLRAGENISVAMSMSNRNQRWDPGRDRWVDGKPLFSVARVIIGFVSRPPRQR